jgi:hypothetical protein
MPRKRTATASRAGKGRLRIGDDWNAIRIIALSQSNPLKAIAEFVENSIDANARTVTITRGRERGEHYLAIRDDGDGIPRDADGRPDYRYVATHICDSIKRRLKADGGGAALQGEFGIGLLSFWTVGERLQITSTGADDRAYQMTMSKGDPGYEVTPRRVLFAEGGTELRVAPLLEGIRGLSGEKIQWYLASELRDRIRKSGVRITVIDKVSRKQYAVEPRQFDGRLLHQLPAVHTRFGDVYAELYLAQPDTGACVGLYRAGTRVVEDLATLPGLEHAPWTSGLLQGLLDAPFLSLTPGTRSGLVHDERYAALLNALGPLESHLTMLIAEQRRAEEEQASRELLRTIQRAFREAMLKLPPEEYDWFDIQARARREVAGHAAGGNDRDREGTSAGAAASEAAGADGGASAGPDGGAADDASGSARDAASGDAAAGTDAAKQAAQAGEDALAAGLLAGVPEPDPPPAPQREFFEHAGPLFTVVVSPAAATIAVGKSRRFTALPRDRARRRVENDLAFAWRIVEGEGTLSGASDQQVEFHAPATPCLTRLAVTVRQRDTVCDAEALVTVTDTLLPTAATGSAAVNMRGLPGYTFERTPGSLWRSRFDAERNVIVVNSGHRDFVFASRTRSRKLRYLIRLYVKELVLRNFTGLPTEQVLERMIELSLYAEEKL